MARIGKYVVTAELGHGGQDKAQGAAATVYSALDPVIGRLVAVKAIVKAGLDPAQSKDILQRLQREAQAAGKLNHPNIVAIYEYGEDAAQAWIAMELLPGKTLREHVIAGYRPGLEALPEILAQILEALDYAHGRGITHRDLKPASVLISDMGVAKIRDFGIARIDRSHDAYTAPEQLEGRIPDERTDIYSAAVIVHEVLTGKLPADGPDTALPQPLREVLARALSPRPEDRPATARELLEMLRTALRGSANLAKNLGALRRAITAAPQAVAPKPARKLPAVLFVDDEVRVLNALRSLFEAEFEVETATSGAEALEKLKARRFLVVVSDQRMPEMTGVELLREAKTTAPSTVRILLTGYSDLAAIVGSVNESEVFRFASKPWQQDELRATLDEAVSVAIALEAAAASGRGAPKTGAAVLFAGEPELARAARQLSRGAFPALEATDGAAALEVLAREEIGVLVCDLEGGSEDPAALLRVLKGESPQTQLVVASAASDSELVIGLINEARIYRFLKKPVNLALLEQALTGALERYAREMATPGLQRVERAKAGRDSVQARSFLDRIKGLGGRFAKALAR